MVLKKEREYIKGPIPLDESWWTAVLVDVESWYKAKQGQNDPEESLKRLVETETPPFDESKAAQISKEESPMEVLNWDYIKQLYECDQVISLEVDNYNRGGLLVHGNQIQGFVPASHLVGLSNTAPNNDRDDQLSDYVGQSLQLKVIECDQERGRVVLSERAAQTNPGSRLELLDNLCVGDHKHGRVTTITNFGVFVDLGGVEGLIHISELSWGRVCHPDTIVSPGEEIDVHILSIDRARTRVALSIKRLLPNPWDSVHSRYETGQFATAVITNIVSFGAFARLEDGLDGLIHVTEIRKLGTEQEIEDIITEGQCVDVCILHIDSTQQRLGLGLRIRDDGVV
jgi:small subunit ribosomal protein S1